MQSSDDPSRLPPLATFIGVLLIFQAVSFLFFAVVHFGIPVADISEPRIPAAVVESIICVCVSVATAAVLARRAWGWWAALAAQLVALAGSLIGVVTTAGSLNVVALGLGVGPVLGLIVILTGSGKRALRHV